jgi:hypothetical protein
MKNYLIFFLLVISSFVSAQQPLSIFGTIRDCFDKRIAVPGCIVVNMRTQKGILANEDGSFTIMALTGDTIGFRTIGYEFRRVIIGDSLTINNNLIICLTKQSYQLNEVMIIPQRGLDSIAKDISKLGYDERKFILQGVDAIQSPVTYLYQLFSRNEKSKREVAFLLNEDARRHLLRELLNYYSSSGFINVSTKDYDEFIAYCALNEAQLKTLTQYELAVYIKKKYQIFQKHFKR